ncbi:MAG TPA: hypothetical protein VK988_19035 [Acidimicrobiales bacterium]|nr:hypothetical protein [Acidimicrobiales bacterium]
MSELVSAVAPVFNEVDGPAPPYGRATKGTDRSWSAIWLDDGTGIQCARRHDQAVRPEWLIQMQAAAEEFGSPIFGLLGPHAREGVFNGWGGRPCIQVTLLYRPAAGRIEVTTGAKPLGGTWNLVHNLLARSIPDDVRLPWGVSIDERLVMLPVGGTLTEFQVVVASTGDWMAAGGTPERHLLLAGSSGTAVDDLRLGPVGLNFEAAIQGAAGGQAPDRQPEE